MKWKQHKIVFLYPYFFFMHFTVVFLQEATRNSKRTFQALQPNISKKRERQGDA